MIVGDDEEGSTVDNEPLVISEPYNFKHLQHVKPDPHTSTGFTGLPDELRYVLKASGISKDETNANPQAVLDVLTFHMEGGPPKQLQSRTSMKRDMTAAMPIIKGDYKQNYDGYKKLGQGASGIIYHIYIYHISN